MKIIMYKLKIGFLYTNILLSFLLIQIRLVLIVCFLPLLLYLIFYNTSSLPENELYEGSSKITEFRFQMPPGTYSALPPKLALFAYA